MFTTESPDAQRFKGTNKFSMAKHLRYFDLHLPVYIYIYVRSYILERWGLERGVRSFRGIRGEYLVVFHPLEMDTLAYPFLKRFLFSFRGTPRVLYHIYGSIRFNVYPLDRDNALFLSLFEVTFGNPRSKRFLPLRSWIETRPRTNVVLNTKHYSVI